MPGYKEIAVQLEEKVLAGAYDASNGRLPIIDDLCHEFNASRVTIFRAVGVLKEKGVLNTSPKRGISVTRLKRKRSNVLGAVLKVDGGSNLHDQLISGMQQTAAQHGLVVAITSEKKNLPGTLSNQIKDLVEIQNVDGVIVWNTDSKKRAQYVDYLKENEIPFVLLPEADLNLYADCNVVNNNNTQGVYDIMKHLLKKNHKSIGFLGENFTSSHEIVRYQQYSNSMQEAGHKSIQYSFSKLQLSSNPFEGITALVCATDIIAFRVLQICLDLGIKVPHDLAIVGYDNIHTAKVIGLSSVEQNFKEIGALAIDLLVKDLNQKLDGPEHISVKSKLIIRNSSMKMLES